MAPSAVSFGPIAGSTTAEETVTIRNVSVRPVRVRLQVRAPGAVSVTATPRFLRVPAGERRRHALRAGAGHGREGSWIGSVSVIPATGIPQRALWSLTLGEAGPPLLANVELVGGAVQDEEEKSQLPSFEPSDAAPQSSPAGWSRGRRRRPAGATGVAARHPPPHSERGRPRLAGPPARPASRPLRLRPDRTCPGGNVLPQACTRCASSPCPPTTAGRRGGR